MGHGRRGRDPGGAGTSAAVSAPKVGGSTLTQPLHGGVEAAPTSKVGSRTLTGQLDGGEHPSASGAAPIAATARSQLPELARALGDRGSTEPTIHDAATAAIEHKSSGTSVDPDVASRVGGHLGADFAGVRVHGDPLAQQATAAMGARAFAFGNDVFLGDGESSTDLPLMAHELTHVWQQGAAEHRVPQRQVQVGDANTPAEQQADQVAAEVTSGQSRPAQLLVDHGPVQPGQMLKSQFIEELRAQVTAAADEELGPLRSAIGCPYIEQYFNRYATRAAAEGEALLGRFAPATRAARTAQDMVQPVLERVREGVRHWRDTGQPPSEIAVVEPAAAVAAEASAAHALRAPDGRETMASLEADLGPGQPLDAGTAARMSSALGTDVGTARIHTGTVAARKAADAGAVAFAVGHNVVLGPGAPAAGTLAGDALLAHELAHTVQQRGAAGDAVARRQPIASESPAAEEHADAAAAGALVELHGEAQPGMLARIGGAARKLASRVSDSFQSGLSLQRCNLFSEPEVINAGVVHGNAVPETHERFAAGNVPGQRPDVLLRDGVSEVRIDGDGDQMKELRCQLRVSDRWPSGSARRLHVEITQMSSSMIRSADYDLPDGAADPFPTFSQATDGRDPTVVDLHGAHLNIFPPNHLSLTETSYRGDLVAADGGTVPTQSHEFRFPRETTPLRDVFASDAASTVGGIWSSDLSIGAYHDRFRVTLEQPTGSAVVHLGLSVLDGRTGEPVAGDRVDLQSTGPFRPQVIAGDPVRFSIDINGDGTSDLDFFDRMVEPASYDGGDGHPERSRDHSVTTIGPSLPQRHEFHYSIRDGMISAGRTAPHAEDRQAASNATAVTGLDRARNIGVDQLTRADQRGTLQGEIDMLDAVLARARQQASLTNPPLISPDLFEAWSTLSRDITVLEAQRVGRGVTADHRELTITHADAFHRGLRAAVRSQDIHHRRRRVDVTTNEYSDPGWTMASHLREGNYVAAIADYRRQCDGLDRWIAYQRAHTTIAMANSDENAVLGQVGQIATLRRNIDEVRGNNPTRVAAVFHPSEPYEQSGQITEIPLSLYLWKDGRTFHLRDVTDSDGPHEMLDSDADHVPDAIFAELADSSHYPRGTIHYQVPGGIGGQQATTGPGRWRQILSWVGLGLGVVGLGLATFATGGLAAVGAAALAGSAIAGGVVAATDLIERFRHGNLSPTTAIVDSAQIVAAIAGLGALRSAGVVNAAREAAAAGVPLTEAAALTAQWHSRAVVALTAVGATSDAVQLAIFVPEAVAQYDAIGASGADEETKRRQRLILLSQLAMTSGFTMLSVRGAAGEFTPGRGVAITYENGIAIAVPQGMSLPGRAIQGGRPRIAADVNEASFLAAEQQHLGTIRSQVAGTTGETLAGIEDLAQRTAWRTEEARRIMQPIVDGAAMAGTPPSQDAQTALRTLGHEIDAILTNPNRPVADRRAAVRERIDAFRAAHPTLTDIDYAAALARANAVGVEGVHGVLLVDAAGRLTRDGSTFGTLDELILKVNQANNAARAHGLPTEYSVRVVPQGEGQPQRVEVTSSERSVPLSPQAAAPLYTQAPARSHAQAEQIARLRQHAPGTTVELMSSGQVRVNNQLDIQPARLAELNDAQLGDIGRTTAALERTGGDINALAPAERRLLEQLSSSGGARLRFRAQYGAQLDEWLVAMQLDQNPQLRALLADASDTDRIRLWDLYNESKSPRGIANPRMRRQAADYALSRNPRTVYEFVEHYQFYQVEFNGRLVADEAAYRAQVSQARTDNPALTERAAQMQESARRYGTAFEGFGDQFNTAQREKVARDLAGGGDPNTPSADTRRLVGDAYQQNTAAMRGHIGAQGIPPAGDPSAARAAIQALPEVRFATDSSGAYHAHKHAHDLPPAEQTGSEVVDYLNALRETIRRPSSQSTTANQLEPGRSHAFTRTVDVRPGGAASGPGDRYTMTAIVNESPDGAISVATLLVSKGKIR
jgi:hypothetical protein